MRHDVDRNARRRCPSCRQMTMARVGPVAEWPDDPPPVDAHLYALWRCTFVHPDPSQGACRSEIKRKEDGAATADPRWSKPIEGLHL